MNKLSLARAVALATLGSGLILPALAHADFIQDSTARLDLRNFYLNRDLRDTTAAQQSKREEWAQGFMFKAESGFTEGTVGFGLDAYAALGVKLPTRAPTCSLAASETKARTSTPKPPLPPKPNFPRLSLKSAA
jgi:hypothetical protein